MGSGSVGRQIMNTVSFGSVPVNDPDPPPGVRMNAPDPNKIRQEQLGNQLQDEQQKRASSTLFSGGMGLSDSPRTASRVLLGS